MSRVRKRRVRLLLWFWVLAPLATATLGWSSYQALAKERATNRSRLFWLQRAEIGRVVERLDSTLNAFLLRESSLDVADFESFRQTADGIPAAVFLGEAEAGGEARPPFTPSPLLIGGDRQPNPGYARLYFQIDLDRLPLLPSHSSKRMPPEVVGLPALPPESQRALAIERGYTTEERLRGAETAREKLLEVVGLARLLQLGKHAALAQRDPASRAFTPLYVEVPGVAGAPAAELLLARLVDRPGRGKVLQGIWYDGPYLRRTLETLGTSELASGAISLEPAPALLRKGVAAPSGRAEVTAGHGRLGGLALDLHLGGRAPQELRLWSETTTSLAAAWVAYLIALGAIHVSLRRALALSERRARFASAVTHELRTPLTTLCMYAEMLSAGLVREDQREDYYRTLEREASRLAALVDNVLDHAGLESGREAHLERFDLVPWLADLASSSAASDVRFELPEATQLFVRADSRGLERILTNLIDNARKYGAAPIRVTASVERDLAQLRISDAGGGIADPQRVFEAFERGTEGPTESGTSTRGLGLGLALSRDLARAMGGALSLEHAGPGSVTQGKPGARDVPPTTFLVSLPLATPPQE